MDTENLFAKDIKKDPPPGDDKHSDSSEDSDE